MVDYIDNDVSYLIGMIIGRGKIIDDGTRFTLSIEFPFVNPDLEGHNVFDGFLRSITYTMLPRLRNLLGPTLELSPIQERINFKVEFPSQHLVVRDLKLILGDHLTYADFEVPSVLQETNDQELIREFIRGFVDVAGNIRRSNRDRIGLHRVYLDVLNNNWKLPVQLCNLLQKKLEVPVSNILWGHPNLRDPKVNESSSSFKEHQIKIYAHDFVKVGFYIQHKQDVLQILTKENESKTKARPSKYCPGFRVEHSKSKHPLENDKHLPRGVRGKHFDAYWQICGACGCADAKKAMREKKKQQSIFTNDL